MCERLNTLWEPEAERAACCCTELVAASGASPTTAPEEVTGLKWSASIRLRLSFLRAGGFRMRPTARKRLVS